jgi:dihydroorotase
MRHYFVRMIFGAAYAALTLAAQAQYDLVLKGGHVIDPKNGIDAVRDLAIREGKIAALANQIPAASAKRVVDASGLYVVPGLVDIHVHVYAGTGVPNVYYGDNSVYPDPHSFKACTTTMVDAGSSGHYNFPDFKQRIIDRSKTRVLAFVNIASRGMDSGPIEQDLGGMDPKLAAATVKAYPNIVVGIKSAHYQGPEWTPVDRAVQAGTMANVPVMVDFGVFRPEQPHSDLVLKHLRPGDIYTHTYLERVPMFDDHGKVRPYLFEAQKRGVIFDVGHGGGSFVFRYAVPATQQGFFPNSISTDLHIGSMNAGMKDMVNVMSKFLNLRMSLQQVIQASTWNPAREIKREDLGHLTAGANADIAVLRLDTGNFGFLDVEQKSMKGAQRLGCEMTILGGQVMYDLNARAYDPWDKQTSRSAESRRASK